MPISSRFQPPPVPKTKRPPETWSRLATLLAVWMVSRSMSRQTPVATSSVLVAAAAAVRATKGSSVCQYCFGRSPPPAKGDCREAGMWECSATQSDSNPRSSTAGASSAIGMA